MTFMSVFAHMCENFVGVMPKVALFRHYFVPQIKADVPSGDITWIPKASAKESYLDGQLHLKWDEWRAEWCWIKDSEFSNFCRPRMKKVEHGVDWGSLDINDSHPSPQGCWPHH